MDADNLVRISANLKGSDTKSGAAELHHNFNGSNTVILGADWDAKNYSVTWKNPVEDGRWIVQYAFPFGANPKNGDLWVRRRYDF